MNCLHDERAPQLVRGYKRWYHMSATVLGATLHSKAPNYKNTFLIDYKIIFIGWKIPLMMWYLSIRNNIIDVNAMNRNVAILKKKPNRECMEILISTTLMNAKKNLMVVLIMPFLSSLSRVTKAASSEIFSMRSFLSFTMGKKINN